MQGSLSKKAEYNSIDIFKFICAFLIITIHASPLSSFSLTADFYLVHVIARVAVPFFYAASGFLLFKKISFENGKVLFTKENKNVIFKFVKHITIMYVVWSAIYLVIWWIPYWQSINWVGFHVVKDYVFSFIFRGSVYHFWYLLGLIYGVPILAFLLRSFGKKGATVIAVILYLIKSFFYAYSWLPIPGLSDFAEIYNMFGGIIDTVSTAVAFMMIGVLFATDESKNDLISKKKIGGILLSAVLLCAEASALYFFVTKAEKYSYLFFTLPLCYFLFYLICGLKVAGSPKTFKTLRKCSTLIYCIHPLLINIFSLLDFYNNVNSLLQYIVIALCSTVVAYIIVKIADIKKLKFLKILY